MSLRSAASSAATTVHVNRQQAPAIIKTADLADHRTRRFGCHNSACDRTEQNGTTVSRFFSTNGLPNNGLLWFNLSLVGNFANLLSRVPNPPEGSSECLLEQ